MIKARRRTFNSLNLACWVDIRLNDKNMKQKKEMQTPKYVFIAKTKTKLEKGI